MSDLVEARPGAGGVAGRRLTPARVSLGRTGAAIATRDHLEFQLDHALARDAVHARLDGEGMLHGLRERGLACVGLRSAADEGEGRQMYLRRPDLGRRLSAASAAELRVVGAELEGAPEVVFVIADGLSARAAEGHALAVLDATLPVLARSGWRVGPVCVVSQGRVAIGDEIGSLLQARATVVLIGERPGLSSPESLGAYLTWDPRLGRVDAERNCVSNIRPEGLSYEEAAERVAYLLEGARRLGASGVELRWQAAAGGSVRGECGLTGEGDSVILARLP